MIREDVIDQVYNLDEGIPTPFIDMVRGGSFTNVYSEWTEDDLTAPNVNNAKVDGSDAVGNDTKLGRRLGNRAQLSDKVVRISDHSENVTSIGRVGTMAYQVAKRLMDLRRDKEAIATGRQGSAVDNGDDVPGKTAGFGAWLKTNVSFGNNGAAGGFNLNTKVVAAPTAGEARAMTWTDVRAILLGIYKKGGYPSVLMTVPEVIQNVNSFLFGDGGKPFRATPHANVQGDSPATQTAQGYISVVLSDFGIRLRLQDNRLQQTYASSDGSPIQVADVFIFDPRYVGVASMNGTRNKLLGDVGHSTNRLLAETWMTKCFREDAHGLIADVNPASPVTAGS